MEPPTQPPPDGKSKEGQAILWKVIWRKMSSDGTESQASKDCILFSHFKGSHNNFDEFLPS